MPSYLASFDTSCVSCVQFLPRKVAFMLREPITISRTLMQEIVNREEAEFRKRTPRSQQIHQRAKASLPMGVSSSFQAVPPYPLFISRAEDSSIWDIDGNRYTDFHLGFGSLLVGHSHPILVKALSDQLGKGSLYSLPSPDVVYLAEEMKRRFAPIEQVRFCNSGTEATMDALRLARAHVGRDKIVKIEGSYHGHHDTVLMSTKPSVEAAGPAERPHTVPASKGIPTDVKQNTIIAPYNDPEALDRTLTEHKGEVAAVITEAVLMNVGIMLPDEGYLQTVRDITRKHGVLLIFDEVKTGVTVAPGGVTEIYPVEPDLICLAKSIGGGMPIGAFGGREEIMRRINHSEVLHLGTFNGNPMSMRAGLVTLTQIFTPEAHTHASDLSKQL